MFAIVEGNNDIQFLKQVSRVLHEADSAIPDLSLIEQVGALIFVPIGGNPVACWTERLAALGCTEFYLFDREIPPETARRERIVATINRRPRCQAVLTSKRALENYLTPEAIYDARGIEVEFGDDDDVADLTACKLFESRPEVDTRWQCLPWRARKRLRNSAKRWLNAVAAECMTAERLAKRDPRGEVQGWLKAMLRLLPA